MKGGRSQCYPTLLGLWSSGHRNKHSSCWPACPLWHQARSTAALQQWFVSTVVSGLEFRLHVIFCVPCCCRRRITRRFWFRLRNSLPSLCNAIIGVACLDSVTSVLLIHYLFLLSNGLLQDASEQIAVAIEAAATGKPPNVELQLRCAARIVRKEKLSPELLRLSSNLIETINDTETAEQMEDFKKLRATGRDVINQLLRPGTRRRTFLCSLYFHFSVCCSLLCRCV